MHEEEGGGCWEVCELYSNCHDDEDETRCSRGRGLGGEG